MYKLVIEMNKNKFQKQLLEIEKNNSFSLYFIENLFKKEKRSLFNNEKIETLSIFDFHTKELDSRIIGEEIMECKLFKEPVIGFQNRQCVLNTKNNHLFEVLNGHADNYKSHYEGIHYKNLFATYNLGPLLIRNPILKDYIIKDILESKDILYKHIPSTDEKAYNEYVKNFIS